MLTVEQEKLLRCMRRLKRLRELSAPEDIVNKEVALIRKVWAFVKVRSIPDFPDDLVAIAIELGLVGDPALCGHELVEELKRDPEHRE